MFRNVLHRLFHEASEGGALSGQDAELAIAALLIRVARSDDRYTDVERGQIDGILARRSGLSSTEAADWRAVAEMIEAEAPDTVRLTRTIKTHFPLEERAGIVGLLWEVALADGRRSPDEEATVRLTSGLLGVPDRESARARQRVVSDLRQAI